MKLAAVGLALLAAGGAAIAVGILPIAEVWAIGDRVLPILLFVVAVTVVAELAARAGAFDVAAAVVSRIAGGRAWLLWFAVVGLAVLATAFLSLDTTAVLLTPVVVSLARAHRLSPLPFVFATVWLANTASLILPVSNLTNLLAVDRLHAEGAGGGAAAFLALLGPSAAVAVVVPVAVLAVVFRRELRAAPARPAPPTVADPPLLRISLVVLGLMMPLLVILPDPWIPAAGAAVLLVAGFAWRSPRTLRPGLVPWQLVLFASGLFLVVRAVESWGSAVVVAAAVGGGDDLWSLWRLSGGAAIVANAVNNLPAYLALEATADSPTRLAALLIGVNAGPLITPWASLATLLWHDRLAAAGEHVSWRRFVLWGLLVAPLTVAAAVIPLAVR